MIPNAGIAEADVGDMAPPELADGGFAAGGATVSSSGGGGGYGMNGCDNVVAQQAAAELDEAGNLSFELAVEEGVLGYSQQLVLEIVVTETATGQC